VSDDRPPLSPLRRVVRTVGELFVTSGLLILLFVAYLLWWTDVEQHRTQTALKTDLQLAWQSPTYDLAQVKLGKGIAVLRIPRLGGSYVEVIVEGVATADLQKGPGHYPGTANAGEVGNFVVSGHRTTYGKPFSDLDKVKPGDLVVVETKDQWLTYRAVREEVVLPTQVEVIRPVPPGFDEPGRYLTFTTCTPKLSASHRLILHGELLRTDGKAADFVPRALRPAVVTVTDLLRQA
jgi:sortase A